MTRPPGYERVYLPLCKVADTPFHIQGDHVCIIPASCVAAGLDNKLVKLHNHGFCAALVTSSSSTDDNNIKTCLKNLYFKDLAAMTIVF